jgi:hypothetical protein
VTTFSAPGTALALKAVSCKAPFPHDRTNATRGPCPVKTLVIDASVAAKWFLPPMAEPHADRALDLLTRYVAGQVRFVVPDLFGLSLATFSGRQQDNVATRPPTGKMRFRCCGIEGFQLCLRLLCLRMLTA